MKKMTAVFLTAVFMLGPVSLFADELTTADLSIPEYTGNYIMLANACVQWTQQCKDDPFDPGRQDCTQRCLQYESDVTSSSSGSVSEGGGGEMGIIGSIGGLVLVGLILYWALTSPG